MSLQQKDDSRYDFQMPKFWDFTNSIPQKRPDESWFCPANVSGPSFPWLHKKKRRALRVKHPLNKPVESQNQHAKAPVPEKPATNVFDRLSTHSTISASKKMHLHLSVEKGRPTPKPHAPPQQKHPPQATAEAIVTQEDEQYQLNQDTAAEPVADRIARIEKELALNNNASFKRSNSYEESPPQPSKIQKIINAQFSSLSSSLSFKQDIPRSRSATAINTITNMKPTTKHSILVEPAANIKTTQPAPQQRPPVANRKSLYDKLQMQKTGPLQQNEKIRSSTPVLSSMISSSYPSQSQTPRPPIINRKSLYHELQSQKNSSSQQKEEKLSSTPIPRPRPTTLPSPQLQAPRPPSFTPQPSQLPQSQMQSQTPLPSQPPPSSSQQPTPPPLPQDDAPMKEAEVTQNNDDTATSDFFEDLLKARRKKANLRAPMQSKEKTSVSTDDFFDSLLKSNQEKPPLSANGLEEEENTGKSTANFFDNLLKTTEKRHTTKAPQQQQQQDKGNTNVSHGNFDTLLKLGQAKHKQNHSLQTDSRKNQEHRDKPSRASSIDIKQSKQQVSYKSPSVPSHTVIAIDQHKENVPESVPAIAVPPRLTQMHATPSKHKYILQEDKYFIDERIAKARKALRESKERTRKWLEALSPNQPMKH